MAEQSFHTSCMSYVQRFQKRIVKYLRGNSHQLISIREKEVTKEMFFLNTKPRDKKQHTDLFSQLKLNA